jgi:hypothetical protein
MRDWHSKPWDGDDTQLALFVASLVLAALLAHRLGEKRIGRGPMLAGISLLISVAVFVATKDFKMNIVAQLVVILGFLAVTKRA